jgi:hypothetical protein
VLPLSAGELFHVVGTYGKNFLNIYVNGGYDNQAACTRVLPSTGGQALRFGKGYSGWTNNKWLGIIYEIRFYSKELNSSEVGQLWDPKTRWEIYPSIKRRSIGLPPGISSPTQAQLMRHGTWFGSGAKQKMWWAK